MDKIEKTIELKAPISKVWKALTDYKEFGTWFQVDLENPFVVGEVTRGQMTYKGCSSLSWEATITKMEPQHHFAYTWAPGVCDDEKDKKMVEEAKTLVEFDLKEIPQGTLLTITESGFEKVPENYRNEAFRRNDGGWNFQIKNIEAHVS